jgi:UDP-glucose 4-epimerase
MLNLKVISSLIALVIFIKGYSQNITNPFENLKKIIYISTLDVYENSDEISEFSKTVPATLYGLSKLNCDGVVIVAELTTPPSI